MTKHWPPTRLTRWLLALGCGAALALGAVPQAHAEDDFLDPEQAFRLSARLVDPQHVEVHFDIAPGYYLYRDKLSATAVPTSVTLGEQKIPPGQVKYDENFEKDVAYFRNAVDWVVPVPQAAGAAPFKLVIGNQGCADKGLCYPPMQRALQVETGPAGLVRVGLTEEKSSAFGAPGGLLTKLGVGAPVAAAASAPASAAVVASPQAGSDEPFARALQSRSLFGVAGLFLLAGVLLSFTPCVLPMLPILSSIVVGQAAPVSKARGFSLALAYSLGMVIVYTAFGVAAALIGGGLGSALQNAWVLGAFALLLVLLSLSMFDVYELRIPSAVHNRLSAWSNGLQGGRYAGVFAMGGLSALIVGPCIAAPLAGALVYISQTRDVLLGGVALFSLASGMSVPLLVLGLSAGVLLPRSGGWMTQVKHFFGLLLLATALWMVSPVMPVWGVMLLAALLMLSSAVYLGTFERLHGKGRLSSSIAKGLGLMLVGLAVAQLAGVVSGGRSVLQPLAHWGVASGGPVGKAASLPLNFKAVASADELAREVAASSRPVMVDWYADWCVACKEFESFTLSQPAVREKLSGMTLLRIDLTANSAQDQALLRKYRLFGPPALLFFAPGGGELESVRVVGFQAAPEFLAQLDRVEALAPSAPAR